MYISPQRNTENASATVSITTISRNYVICILNFGTVQSKELTSRQKKELLRRKRESKGWLKKLFYMFRRIPIRYLTVRGENKTLSSPKSMKNMPENPIMVAKPKEK